MRRAVTLTLRWSRNGPILSGRQFDLGQHHACRPCRGAVLDGAVGADTSMTAAMHLMQAKSVAEALEAGRLFMSPRPEPDAGRPGRHRHAGDRGPAGARCGASKPGPLPAPGWLPETGFKGIFPYEDNPRWVNPPSASWAIPTTRPSTCPSRGTCPSSGAIPSASSAGWR
jgi:penicillin amidase